MGKNVKIRDNSWDNIKGVLILLVVFGHCLYGLQSKTVNSLIVEYIYFFHMPAFVFVSGYFSKGEKSRSRNAVITLLVAYVICMLPFMINAMIKGESIKILSPYYSAWYLLALIIWRLVTPYLINIRHVLIKITIFSILVGFFESVSELSPFAIRKVVMFYPFFIAGYLFTSEMYRKKFRDISLTAKLSLGAAALFSGSALILFSRFYLGANMGDVLPNAYKGINLTDPIIRAMIFIVSSLMICAMMLLTSDRQIPLLTKIGRNTLPIFVMHRMITMYYYKSDWIVSLQARYQIILSLILTLIIAAFFGSELFARVFNGFIRNCTDSLVADNRKNRKYKIYRSGMGIFIILVMLMPVAQPFILDASSGSSVEKNNKSNKSESEWSHPYSDNIKKSVTGDPMYRVMTRAQEKQYDDAFRLLFAGDLILLEDQVKNAYNGKKYEFDECFEYTKDYIASADYSIGVLEGPTAGSERGYSSSNYGDGKKLALNFPDEWVDAVKNAGFDLVTTANNHALDKGISGMERTIRVLKDKNLDFIGTYLNGEDKNQNSVKIIEKDGIKIAILSYTSFINHVYTNDIVSGDKSYISSVIVNPENENFYKIKKQVKKDFEKASEANADLIVVLPHWGTQFASKPNEAQLEWEKIFKEYGADIILGDHTHSVEPVYIDKENDNSYTLYSPGNYANIYREHDGDFSAMTEVYIDRKTKSVIGGAIIPMWTNSTINGNYRAIPVYDIITDKKLTNSLTTYDLERVKKAQEHISKTMLGNSIPITSAEKRYYFDENGYMRKTCRPLNITDEMKAGEVYKLLTSSQNVCFIGDSVTEGTKNGGVPWYEPISGLISGKITNCGWGSYTVKKLMKNHMDDINSSDADLFVIAIGTNDVRYRNRKTCSMTPGAYTEDLQLLRNQIAEKHPDAEFIFIAPWTSTDGDKGTKLKYEKKVKMNNSYSEALKKWTEKNGDVYVNANRTIDKVLDHYPDSDYLLDAIHPNATKGVELYSKAVLLN